MRERRRTAERRCLLLSRIVGLYLYFLRALIMNRAYVEKRLDPKFLILNIVVSKIPT